MSVSSQGSTGSSRSGSSSGGSSLFRRKAGAVKATVRLSKRQRDILKDRNAKPSKDYLAQLKSGQEEDARSEAAKKEFAKRRDWLAKRQGNVEGLHDDIAAAHRRNDTMRVAELKIALRRAEKSWRAFAQSLRDMLAAPPDELRPAKERQEAVELGSAGTAAAAAAQALLKVDRFRTESARAAAEDEAAPLFHDFEAYFNPDKPRPPSPPRGPVVPDTETNYYGNLCACCLLSLLTLTYVSPSSFA